MSFGITLVSIEYSNVKLKYIYIYSFVDDNFIFDISIRMSSFRDTKFKSSIRYISHQFFLDISKLKAQLEMF